MSLHIAMAHFERLKIRHKVILSFIALSIIPILLVNLYTSYTMQRILIQHERSLVNDSFKQAILQVESQLKIFNTLSDYVFNDTEVLKVVNAQYGQNFFQMYKAYQLILEPRFLTYYALHSSLTRITVYSDCDLYPYASYAAPLSDIQDEAWFLEAQDQYQPVWLLLNGDRSKLVNMRKLTQSRQHPYQNYVYMEIDSKPFFKPLESVTTSAYSVVVVNSANQVIFGHNEELLPIETAQLLDGAYQDDGSMLVLSMPLGSFTAYYVRPMSDITRQIGQVTNVTSMALWMILLLLGILSLVFTNALVSPLEALTKNMEGVLAGDMQVTVDSNRQDEIGILIKSYRAMITQIQHLFQVVYKNEIEKREFRLKILHAQINPHFLYNTLSLINSKAILAGRRDISQIAQLVSSFYRSALNHGKDITTIRNEVVNTRSYIDIQLMLNNDCFTTDYDIDPSLDDCKIPNFVLQPVVENAIIHGLMNDTKPEKRLAIQIQRRDEQVMLTVTDNGTGITAQAIENILGFNSGSYGLYNVNERLTLYYQSQGHLQMHSTPGIGTTVTLEIPFLGEFPPAMSMPG